MRREKRNASMGSSFTNSLKEQKCELPGQTSSTSSSQAYIGTEVTAGVEVHEESEEADIMSLETLCTTQFCEDCL